jgi:hypothetical protein
LGEMQQENEQIETEALGRLELVEKFGNDFK